MPRSMMGLLAAVGAIMAALVGFTHGDLVPVLVAGTGVATGLAAYLTAPSKKIPNFLHLLLAIATLQREVAARASGLALALAVRPAGLAEAPALKGGS